MHRNTRLLGKSCRSCDRAGGVIASGHGESPSRFSTRERLKIRPIRRARRSWPARFDQQHSTGIIDVFRELFRRAGATKQFPRGMKPFCALAQTSGNSPWLTTADENGGRRRRPKTGDGQMRTLSFMLALAFVVAGGSIAGSSGTSLPGVGTFAYSGSPVAASAPEAIFVAAR
jgi:hypothetical protein